MTYYYSLGNHNLKLLINGILVNISFSSQEMVTTVVKEAWLYINIILVSWNL